MGDSADPVDTSWFLRKAQAHQNQESGPDTSSSQPIVTRLPEGYIVVEQRVGRATARWLLHVHCECGSGWFECEAKTDSCCPTCGQLVHLDIQPLTAP